MNNQNECKPIPTACIVPHCASCDDDSTCNQCNIPFTLNEDNGCELCEEGTYFNNRSCESISFKMKIMTNYDKECADENCAFCQEDGTICRICLNGFIMNDLDGCEPISTAESCNHLKKAFF